MRDRFREAPRREGDWRRTLIPSDSGEEVDGFRPPTDAAEVRPDWKEEEDCRDAVVVVVVAAATAAAARASMTK